ncbi:MAG: hypothetical protein V1754_06265 [Pseudomonadota bacterium]
MAVSYMSEEENIRLKRLGIQVVGPDDDPEVHAASIQIARRLLKTGQKKVGFWPAGPNVAVPPLAVQLGAAIVELTGSPVAFVDANVRWPVDLALANEQRFASDSIFATRWLCGSLAMLIPQHVGAAGAGVPQLKMMLEQSEEYFVHLLVDLTGYDSLGDHFNAIGLLDGVVVVGLAGSTTEEELLTLERQIPASKSLGVVLIG